MRFAENDYVIECHTVVSACLGLEDSYNKEYFGVLSELFVFHGDLSSVGTAVKRFAYLRLEVAFVGCGEAVCSGLFNACEEVLFGEFLHVLRCGVMNGCIVNRRCGVRLVDSGSTLLPAASDVFVKFCTGNGSCDTRIGELASYDKDTGC